MEVGELQEALRQPKIKDATLTELQGILRGIMIMVGLRAANLPTQEEMGTLLRFIYKKYELLTIGEIQLAFEKAVAGELDVEANCYENFSCEYFGKIMTAYKSWARAKWNENQMYMQKNDAKTPILGPGKADWRPLLELYYQDYLKGTFNMKLMPVEVYGAAVELKYMSADAWEDWEPTAKTVLIGQLQADKFEAMHVNEQVELEERISKVLNGEETDPINVMAKKLAIEFLYQQAKKKGIKNLYIK